MAYFTKESLQFLADLKENNDREWYHANKKRYETHVKKPFTDFVQVMIDRVQAEDPTVLITPKDAMFRIYRDTRFSKDKTPYKTHLSAAISRGGRKDFSSPGMYLHISAEEVRMYSGVYQPDSKQLQLIREAIASQPEEFAALIADKKFKKQFGQIRGEQNKRIPKEFRDLAESQPLIANKQFYYFAEFAPEKVLDDKLPDLLMDHFRTARPISTFLANALAG